MADSQVDVTEATSSVTHLDAESLTVGAQTVKRERHRIAGGAAAELADVRNSAPSSSDYGIVTRVVGLPAAAALADGTSNPTLSQLQAFLAKWNGATWDRDMGRALGHPIYSSCLPSSAISSGTSASTTISLGYLWHPSSVSLRAFLRRILVTWLGGLTDDSSPAFLRLVRITAENGTPGGTSQTIQAANNGSAASGLTFRTGASGAPTRGNVIFACPVSLNAAGALEITAAGSGELHEDGNAFMCRASTAEGWEVQLVTGAAPSTAALFGIAATWSEA